MFSSPPPNPFSIRSVSPLSQEQIGPTPSLRASSRAAGTIAHSLDLPLCSAPSLPPGALAQLIRLTSVSVPAFSPSLLRNSKFFCLSRIHRERLVLLHLALLCFADVAWFFLFVCSFVCLLKSKARPSTNKRITTRFIVILILLQWCETKPAATSEVCPVLGKPPAHRGDFVICSHGITCTSLGNALRSVTFHTIV